MQQDVVVKLAWSTDQAWRQESACLGWAPDRARDSPDQIPDDPFFSLSAKAQRKAAEFCKEVCPVLTECGKYAIANDERLGVWGGMTERDRLRVKKNDQRTHDEHEAKLAALKAQQQLNKDLAKELQLLTNSSKLPTIVSPTTKTARAGSLVTC